MGIFCNAADSAHWGLARAPPQGPVLARMPLPNSAGRYIMNSCIWRPPWLGIPQRDAGGFGGKWDCTGPCMGDFQHVRLPKIGDRPTHPICELWPRLGCSRPVLLALATPNRKQIGCACGRPCKPGCQGGTRICTHTYKHLCKHAYMYVCV